MLKNYATLLTRAFFCCIFALTKNKIINQIKTNNEKQSTEEIIICDFGVLVSAIECSTVGR